RAPMLLASPNVSRGNPGPALLPPGIPIFSAKLPIPPVSVVRLVDRVRLAPTRASFRMLGETMRFQLSVMLLGSLIPGVVGMARTGFAVESLRLPPELRPAILSLQEGTLSTFR